MSLRDDINIPLVTVLGITTGLIVAVAIVGTQAGYNYVTQSELNRNYQTAEAKGWLKYGESVLKPQDEKLHAKDPAWVFVDGKPNKDFVQIPIDRAKDLMVQSKGKPVAK